jgi:serine/threonine protein kinase
MPIPSDEPIGATTALEQLGRYQLLGKLGQGGMGTVFLANDTRLDRRVAIKVLPPESVHDPDAVARFQREAKALAKLSHPGIVQAFDAEEDNGRHFLVMEYVEGQSLLDVLKREGRIAPPYAADYIHQAAAALQHAHDKGLVHRDLKPSNLLLSPSGQIKILDLGLARFLQDQIGDPTKTREGMGMGTPDYAAPEQFRDAHHVDGRADIYALGCTLYHLLTGQVPFPGSSLAEKYDAHEHKEPTPIEELCPDVPTGLALVVRRMMAKRPSERFQRAAEAADALSPYVAGSSVSAQRFMKTATWERGQLTLAEFPSRRRRYLPWAVASFAIAAAVIAFMLAWPSLFPRRREQIAAGPEPADGQNDKEGGKSQDGQAEKPSSLEALILEQNPNVLTVSKDKKDGGQFRSINDTLAKVKPGQTIRILDGADYREAITIDQSDAQANITLEAPRRATLIVAPPHNVGIRISNVPGVKLRGFQIRSEGQYSLLVLIRGRSSSAVLEDLRCQPALVDNSGAIGIDGDIPPGPSPVRVQNCEVLGGGTGIYIGATSGTAEQIIVRSNLFSDGVVGVHLTGNLRRVQLVGNRFVTTSQDALHLEMLGTDTEQVLIANNTFDECGFTLRLGDRKVKGKDVEWRNNLVLGATHADLEFLDYDGTRGATPGPADGRLVARAWTFSHNWREVREPQTGTPEAHGWIPPGPRDVRRDRFEGVNRDPKSPEFLRPAKDSPLANSGAGKEDPSLPLYVGALPPPGVKAWDWDRTWRMPRDAQLLTVSKDAKDGGKYRNINDALKDAKPWATIRVLDDATYTESVRLDDPKKQTGLTLEAPRAATLELGRDLQIGLLVQNVGDVCVRGFRFREPSGERPAGPRYVEVIGRVPGIILEDLDLFSRNRISGIIISHLKITADENPAVVRRCAMEGFHDAVTVVGPWEPTDQAAPCQGVVIHDNRITRYKGSAIMLNNAVRQVLIAGNVLWRGSQASVELINLLESSGDIWIANNTMASNGLDLFGILDTPPHKVYSTGQVRMYANLLFNGARSDMMFVRRRADGRDELADSRPLLNAWRFARNWRDLSGQDAALAFPLAAEDRKLDQLPILSVDPLNSDFMRLRADSPPATGGMGRVDPAFPGYVGAVPPRGIEPWDWDRTWRTRLATKK